MKPNGFDEILSKDHKMETIKKQEIKSRIRQIIEGNPEMPMILEVGLTGSRLPFVSKRAFGKRILNQIEQKKVCDIVFEGVDNKTLNFRTRYLVDDTWRNSRGYGQGKHMGD